MSEAELSGDSVYTVEITTPSSSFFDGFSTGAVDYLDFPFNIFFVNFTNTSDFSEGDYIQNLWREIPLGIVLSVLCLLTVAGNAMVLHAVRTERRLQTVSNMFIVSLAIADLIVGIIVMPFSIIYIFTGDWPFGLEVCQMWIVVDYTASTASILNLFILSIDRYWSVKSPLKYIRKRTKKRAIIMITIVWAISCLWVVPIVGWHYFARGGTRLVSSNVCDTEYATNSVFKVVTAFFNYYLPLALMFTLYWKIFQEIRKRSELELGQRFPGVNSSPSLLRGNASTEDDTMSNQRIDILTEDNSPQSAIGNHLSLSTNVPTKSYEMIPIHRHHSRSRYITHYNSVSKPAERKNKLNRCRIEYIYDENVLDPKTEKLERFYYEKQLNIPPNEIGLVLNSDSCQNTMPSSPSTSASSNSGKNDRSPHFRRHNSREILNNQSCSIWSGLNKIREAEALLDQTVSLSDAGLVTGRQNSQRQRNIYVYETDRTRRTSSMFNIKHRLKNIRQSSALTKEIKAARQLGVIMGAFTVCFLPYFILFLVVAFCNGCVDKDILIAVTWIGYLNSTLNPFLYPLCNANFRRKFRRMLGFRKETLPHYLGDHHTRNSLNTGRYD